ncbi:phospholipid/cholesterol/gamma-HCH transport system substrate-binding protein [Puniceibacterium sediminis]|uniref:Phospholipid/cholesterol/gamma-HCH transport system substrate-binding protein n=1 Tax=Puniceibacterium sediminis TaxID=1608407 RepID=A0A238WSV1_9RHOB|nr:MlaD family protein [Puniceibacterium sediminis]SNR49646.1 phospholipid/cholesterol/gamma-HCH transport system substrate-binding protein [Puniceibacterium sediminis]
METRANYLLIGIFTLAGLTGILGFFLWFAQVQLDRQFAYYDVAFTTVSGLSNASDVRFSGLPVGQVVDVRLSPERDGTITARLEIDADTPVRIDSVATIESQGVTGVSYVGISAGTPEAALVEPAPGEIPHIEPGRSVIQTLSEDAPQLLEEALKVVQGLGDILNGENRDRIANILTNVEAASDDFSTTLRSFSNVTESVSGFAEQIDRFNSTLEALTSDASQMLNTASTTLTTINDLTEQAKGFLTDGSATLNAATGTLTTADSYLANDLPQLTSELELTVTDLRQQVAKVREDASRTLNTFNETGLAATARLTEARKVLADTEVMIANLEVTLDTMDSAAISFEDLMEKDGAELIADASVMIADATRAMQSINAVTETDLPGIVADIRTATATANRVIAQVGDDLTGASGRIESLSATAEVTLNQVSETFASANDTLTAVNSALVVGEDALGAAQRAFDGADRVINDDVAGITADLRGAIANLNGAINQVSADIPGISADLRAASRSAEQTFAEVLRVVNASGTPIAEFAANGLPLYSRLAQETRNLIANLDRLTTSIQRDPARFFLDKSTPEFRR